MKKLGLVGGLGPASTVEYYLGMIEKTKEEKGENFYPEIVIDSVNMAQHDKAFLNKDYDKICDFLIESLENLKSAGADIAAITANTEHIVWDMVSNRFPLPVVSIIDAVVEEIQLKGYKKVLIFATAFTLRSGLYEQALKQNGIIPVIPSDEDITLLGKLIYPNLENGIVLEKDRQEMIELAEKYIAEYKPDAMLLGCTEIPLAIKQGDVSVPALNTTKIHINKIFKAANEG